MTAGTSALASDPPTLTAVADAVFTALEPATQLLVVAWLALGRHLAETTVFLAMISLLALALRNAPAAVRYRLWALGLLKLLVPVSLAGTIGAALLPAWVLPSTWLPTWLHPDTLLTDGAWASLASGATTSFLLDPFRTAAAHGTNLGPMGSALVWIVTVTWSFGALRLFLRVCDGHRRLDRLRRFDPAALGPGERMRLRKVCARLGLDDTDFVVTDGLLLPCVAGTLRPRIFLPRRSLEALGAEELVAVAAHERAHLRRREPLRLLALHLAVALFFYFPPLWLVRSRLLSTAEMACDEEALRSGIAAPVLADAIARTLGLGLGLPQTAAGLGSSHRSHLRERLDRLSSNRRAYPMLHHRLVLGVAAVALAALTLSPRVGQSDDEPAAPKKAAGSGSAQTDRPARDLEPAAPPSDPAESETPATFTVPPRPIEGTVVAPVYPDACREANLTGRVLILATISERGEVVATEAKETVDACPAFTDAAIAALVQWRFEPAQKDGQPVTVTVAVPFQFSLD